MLGHFIRAAGFSNVRLPHHPKEPRVLGVGSKANHS